MEHVCGFLANLTKCQKRRLATTNITKQTGILRSRYPFLDPPPLFAQAPAPAQPLAPEVTGASIPFPPLIASFQRERASERASEREGLEDCTQMVVAHSSYISLSFCMFLDEGSSVFGTYTSGGGMIE